MYTKPFTNNLRAHRMKAGLFQKDVAQQLGLDCADRLSRWENGSAVPNIFNLFKLAVLYRVKPHELYGEVYRAIAFEENNIINKYHEIQKAGERRNNDN